MFSESKRVVPAQAVPRLLVVDDDADMRSMLDDALRRCGFEVDGVDTAAGMRRAMVDNDYALILLDLKLRNEDGLVIARELRAQSSVPIVMISGCSDETDRVLLLEVAADDFLVKPFGMRELVARVRAVLRRTGAHAGVAAAALKEESRDRCLRFGSWVIDLIDRELCAHDGTVCALTQGEFRLLEAFVRHPRRVWSRDRLLQHTRSPDSEVFDRSIDVLILRLRRKIEPNPKHPQFICTERGVGYVFKADVAPV